VFGRSGESFVLLAGEDGPVLRPGRRDEVGHGVKAGGVFYPDEFLRPLGRRSYFLASGCEMPASGNLKADGSVPASELVTLPQPEWVASWRSYDSARRRLNWGAVWNRGDGSSVVLRNMVQGFILVCVLVTLWSAWSSRGTTDRLNYEVTVLSGQVARLSGGVDPVQHAAPNPADGSLVAPVATARPSGPSGVVGAVGAAASGIGAAAGDGGKK
jgi:hypothetical protein